MQARLPCPLVADFLLAALDHGVTWWDTSDNYGSHPHVRTALGQVERSRVQVTSKTHARSAADAEESLRQTLCELDISYLDVLLLHEVDSVAEFHQARPALKRLSLLRDLGLVGAIGLSTHSVDVLELLPGDDHVEIILTNYNHRGIHMDADGTDYERILQAAFASGQGVCAMKTLGEGALRDCARESIHHNLSRPWLHGVLVGVTSLAEALAAADIWRQFRHGD